MQNINSMRFLVFAAIFVVQQTGTNALRITIKTAPDAKRKVVYGTMFANRQDRTPAERDYNLLQAQWSSWAKVPCAENRCFATTEADFKASNDKNILRISNPLPQLDIAKNFYGAKFSYKRTDLFKEAVKRDADWLVLHHPDMYLRPEALEKALNEHDHMTPIVAGFSIGCRDASNLYNLSSICPTLQKEGGLCGGGPYMFSRAALKALLSDGDDSLTNLFGQIGSHGVPEDLADGCAMRKHKIEAVAFTQGTVSQTGVEQSNVMVYHPVISPEAIMAIHEKYK